MKYITTVLTLIVCILMSVIVYADDNDNDTEPVHMEGLAVWDSVRVSLKIHQVVNGETIGVADSIYVLAADTSDVQGTMFLVRREVFEPSNDNIGWQVIDSWDVSYVQDGYYYVWAYIWYGDDVYVSDIALKKFTPVYLETPEHGAFGVSKTPEFKWHRQGDRKHLPHPDVPYRFELQIAQDSLFTNVVYTGFTHDTTYTVGSIQDAILEDLVRYWESSMEFDGTQDALIGSQPEEESMFRLDSLSLVAWVNPSESGEEFVSVIIGKDYEGGWQSYAISLRPDNRIRFRTRVPAGERDLISNSSIPLNEWTFIVGTYKPGDKRLYINGELDISSTISGSIEYMDLPVVIGADSQSPDGRRFNGVIARTGIWSGVLSADKVNLLYNDGQSIEYPFDIPILDEDGWYYWRVRSWNIAGPSQWSGR